MIRMHLGMPLLDFRAEKKGGAAPPPPDPYATAGAQTGLNRDTALWNAALNRMDTYTPLGSQTFTQTGTDPTSGAPTYRTDINLTPEQQQLYEQQAQQNLQLGDIAGGMMGQVKGGYAKPLDVGGLDAYRKQAQDAVYDRNAAYLDPQFARGEESTRTRLANQGVVEGSEAWKNAMTDFGMEKEMAYRQARNDAVTAGSGERAQGMQELFALRNQPLNEFNALRSASPVAMPQFSAPAASNTNPADLQGAIYGSYQGQMNAWNAKQQANNNLLGGMFGLGSAALLSDERAKEDIEPVGELNDGTGLFSYRYKGHPETHVGVMAQEVEKTNPSAVITGPDGLKRVKYAKVLAKALEAA